MAGISQKKLLEIIYDAAKCFIPEDELTEEQLWILDNITYRLCDCRRCKEALASPSWKFWKALGHADRRTNSIGLSRDAFKRMAGIGEFSVIETIPIFLLQLMQTILHENIHLLFPEYNEEEVKDITNKWLNSFDWEQVR